MGICQHGTMTDCNNYVRGTALLCSSIECTIADSSFRQVCLADYQKSCAQKAASTFWDAFGRTAGTCPEDAGALIDAGHLLSESLQEGTALFWVESPLLICFHAQKELRQP